MSQHSENGGDGGRPPGTTQEWEGETLSPSSSIAGASLGSTPAMRTPQGARALSSVDATQELGADDSHGSASTLPATQRGVAKGSDFDALPVVPRESYKIGPLLACGGMGRIYEARDRRLGRPVAIKELMSFKPAFVARFEREARITGRLQHPAIVPVYEAGVWPSGEPFFAMKLVAGESLDKIVQRTETLEERLALIPELRTVAEALAYAHSHRIVHRDLKPANVLVGHFGETVVIDWGLAKNLAQSDADDDIPLSEEGAATASAELTVLGAAMGTPSYMPPEQATGQPADERADVYALGAILYHVLAGQPAYSECKTADDIIAKVKKEPPTPILAQVPGAPPDLAAIADKAMARDPAERYPSAKELADDLRRYEEGKRVSVHEYTLTALLGRWLKRHRAVVSVAGIMLVALVVLAVLSVDSIRRERNAAEGQRAAAESQRSMAQGAQARAEARSNELTLLNAQNALERDPSAALGWLAKLPEDEAYTSTIRLLALEARARGVARHVLRGHEGRVYGLAFTSDGARLVSSANDGMVRVWNAGSGALMASNYCGAKRFEVALSPPDHAGETWVAAADDDSNVMLWNPMTGEQRTLAGHSGPVQYLASSPDGTRLVTSAMDQTVRLWDLGSGEVLWTVKTQEDFVKVRFSPDGRLVILSKDQPPRIVDAATGAQVALPAGMEAYSLVMSPDGRYVAGSGSEVHLWDRRTNRLSTLPGHTQATGEMVFSPRGDLLAVADGRSIRLWELGAYTSRELSDHRDTVDTLAFSPDGRLLASGGRDRTVRIFSLDGSERRVLTGHDGWVTNLVFSPDGAVLASASQDGTVRLWGMGDGGSERVVHDGAVRSLLVSRDGRRVISAGADGRIVLWNPVTGEMNALVGHTGAVSEMGLSASGDRLVSAGEDGTVRVWNLRGSPSPLVRVHGGPVTHVALSASGDMVVSAGSIEKPVVWDLGTGATTELPVQSSEGHDIAIAPDGRKVAYADGKDVVVWSRDTGEVQRFTGHEDIVDTLAFSPDGTLVASGGRDQTVRTWEVATGDMRRFDGHRDTIWKVAFSSDGTRLSSAGKEGDIWIWKPRASGAGRKLEGHHYVVCDVMFSPDGRLLASASRDGMIWVWDVDGDKGRVWGQGQGDLPRVVFSPDGAFLAAGAEDGRVVVWPFDAPWAPDELQRWIGGLTTALIDEHDRVASSK